MTSFEAGEPTREVHEIKLMILLDDFPFPTAGEVLGLCPEAGRSSHS